MDEVGKCGFVYGNFGGARVISHTCGGGVIEVWEGEGNPFRPSLGEFLVLFRTFVGRLLRQTVGGGVFY